MKKYSSSIDKYSREKKMMLPGINGKERCAIYAYVAYTAAFLFMILTFALPTADAVAKQKAFASPEDAVKAWITAAKANDDKEIIAIFGAEAKDVIFSGDPVADKQRREKVISAYEQKNSLTKEGDKMILLIGEKDWPFPFPLVKKGNQWVFDIKAGKEEILNRRIGRNELDTIQTMLAIVDAQREYAMSDRNGNGILEYAEKFRSDPGKKNGLHWETKEGEKPSPLGELVAQARAAGYKGAASKGNPVPFHGYYFRMLMKQGKHAPGGAYDYVVNGKMIGGFAVVAYPAAFGNSGVMTFLVNHDGVVYQKDLGKDTVKKAKAMTSFDPDKTWTKVQQQ